MDFPEPEYPRHPRVAVGAVVFKEGKVLLVQRGHPPGKGQWAIPGGSVQLGESLGEAAQREIHEETGITIKATKPIFTFESIIKDDEGQIQFHYVIVDLAAEYIGGELKPGDDAVDVRWVAADEMGTLEVSPPTLDLLKNQFKFAG